MTVRRPIVVGNAPNSFEELPDGDTIPGGMAPPAGSDKQVQYNDNGVAGADAGFTRDASAEELVIDDLTITSFDLFGARSVAMNITEGMAQATLNITAQADDGFGNATANFTLSALGDAGSCSLVGNNLGSLTWDNVNVALVAGSNTQVQFNDGGVSGASFGFRYSAEGTLTLRDLGAANGAGNAYIRTVPQGGGAADEAAEMFLTAPTDSGGERYAGFRLYNDAGVMNRAMFISDGDPFSYYDGSAYRDVWHAGNLLNIGTTASSARTALNLGAGSTNSWTSTQTAPAFTASASGVSMEVGTGGGLGIIGTSSAHNVTVIRGGSGVGTFTATGLNSCAIGATTRNSGAFTSVTSSAHVQSTGPISIFAANSTNIDHTGTVGRIYAMGPDNSTYGSMQINLYSANASLGATVATFTTTGIGVGGAPSVRLHARQDANATQELLRVENQSNGASATARIGLGVGTVAGLKGYVESFYDGAEFKMSLAAGNPATERVRIGTETWFFTKFGYGTGAGGTVTQATNKATAVTLNKACGVITTANVVLNAGTIVSFTLNNSAISTDDLIVCSHHATGTFGAYTINIRATGAGTAVVTIRNNTAGNLTEAIQIKFAVIKGVTS
jgi:hypothetical protein